ncbi:hypothetical protein QYE76_027542 [Lolium multiflorum]|uniref:RNase H type-1 domain-containing protein n=1 Tax=Lolium multiflorum TaxID=4521 RepID=A0AAD8QMK6_LOLMU|nr:hypothetical protein QYE76_027542 [Lolium multiflorum]
MDRGKRIETDLVDFIPHPPSRLDAYAYLEEPMEMTFGRFRFRVEKEGLYRLEIPVSSGLSAVDSDFSDSKTSIESGKGEISPPRFINTMASEKLVKIFGDMSFESSADSDISSDSDNIDSFNFIDKSIAVGKVFTNLYDGVTNPDKYQKYEALIHGMKMAKACGATRLKIFGDSQLVAQQVMNQCDAVNDSIIAYKEVYNELEKLFDGCKVNHISRLRNDEADVLANIGSQCLAIPPGVFWEEIAERSTKAKKQQKKEKEEKPSGAKEIPSGEEDEPEVVMMIQIPWMQAYIAYISRKELPDDPVEARRVIRRSKAFTVVKGELYKRSISGVL